MTIIEAIDDTHLFHPLFKDLTTWKSWLTVFRAIFAIEMTEEERKLFTELSGRETPPKEQVDEAWLICGRRAGKSRMAALIAIYLACFRDYSSLLAPGERITIMVLACDRRQARTIFRYAIGLLERVPMLLSMILRQDSESIDLNNGVTIEITTNNFRSLRGYTVGAAILDEVAYWRSEYSANPDEEVLSALRPSMATVPNALIVGIGSPYRRSGVMYEAYKRHYGQNDSPILVVQAPTTMMNPTVPQSVIDRAMEIDPLAAQAEYFAQFRSDVGSFLDSDLIERAVEPGRRQRAPLASVTYTAFVDPSGGSHDSFTLAVGHRDGERLVLDLLRGIKPSFDPSAVVKEFAALLKSYRCYSVVGDRYAGEWVREQFSKAGIDYRHSEQTKSELYLEALPLFTTGAVDLLDHQPLTVELQQLERRTARSGRDSVDHPPQGRDDHANAVCGCLAVLAASSRNQVYLIPIEGF